MEPLHPFRLQVELSFDGVAAACTMCTILRENFVGTNRCTYSNGPWSGRGSQCSRSVKGMAMARLCCLDATPSDLDSERLTRLCIHISPAHSPRPLLGLLGGGNGTFTDFG